MIPRPAGSAGGASVRCAAGSSWESAEGRWTAPAEWATRAAIASSATDWTTSDDVDQGEALRRGICTAVGADLRSSAAEGRPSQSRPALHYSAPVGVPESERSVRPWSTAFSGTLNCEVAAAAERVRWHHGRLRPLISTEEVTALFAVAGSEVLLNEVVGTVERAEKSGSKPALLECPNRVSIVRRHRDLITGEGTDGRVVLVRCWTKSCEFCATELKRRMVGHYVSVFKALTNLRFVTLTIDQRWFRRHGGTPEGSRKYMVYCWSKLRKRLARRDPTLQFLAAPERHASGFYHLHIVMSCTLSEKELRQQIRAARFGAVADVQDISEAAPKDETVTMELARNVGYTIAYACKDAAGAKGRRAIFSSEGLGYHSVKAKVARAAYIAAQMKVDVAAVEREAVERAEMVAKVRAERAALLAQIQERVPATWMRASAKLARLVPVTENDLPAPEVRVWVEEWGTLGSGRRGSCSDTLTKDERAAFGALPPPRRCSYWRRHASKGIAEHHVYDRKTHEWSMTVHPLSAAPLVRRGDS